MNVNEPIGAEPPVNEPPVTGTTVGQEPPEGERVEGRPPEGRPLGAAPEGTPPEGTPLPGVPGSAPPVAAPPQPPGPPAPGAVPPAPDQERTDSAPPPPADGGADAGQRPPHAEAKPYVPIAALTHPGQLPAIDSVANLFAGPTGPVTIHQTREVRTADLLETVAIPREKVLADASYVEAQEWEGARRHGAEAVHGSSVVFVVAPRRFGATTFSLRLLAEETDPAVALQVVEPSWDRPLVSRLPVQPGAAYLLDFQDPERDRVDGAFLAGLGRHAQSLRKVGSHLVLTITPELWSAVAGQVPDEVAVVRLTGHPKAGQVVRRHLAARGRADLARYLNDSRVQTGITGWSPARAVWLVDEMIARADADARTAAEEGADPAERTSQLLAAARELAEGWTDLLNSRFADSGRTAARASETAFDAAPLDLDDRCLSLALAVRRAGPVTRIQADAERLAGLLAGGHAPGGGKSADRKGSADLRKVLGGVGLRTRFETIGAEVRFGDAHFTSPQYGDALLAYVWDQYHPLHERLVGWMMSCGGQDGGTAHDDPAVRALLGVLTYHQDDRQLAEIRKQGAAQERRAVAAAVLAGAARDEHLGRRARQLLYSWAGHKDTDTQQLVVAVCRELIDDQPLPALTRLRRVADTLGDGDGAHAVTAEVLGAFRDIARTPELTAWFATTVADWQKQAGQDSSHAVSLGTLALMSVDADGRPWLLTAPAPALDVSRALRGLFVDLDRNAGVIEEISRWLRADGGALREQVLALVQEAVAQRVGLRALARLIDELGRDGTASRPADILGDDPELGGLGLGASPA